MRKGLMLALVVLMAFSLIASACATAATPTPAPAATKAPEVTKPASEATKAPAPAATKAPEATKPAGASAAKPAASADWKAEWDKTLAAAKKEGKLVVSGARGELWRAAAMEFQKAYPDITMEYTGAAGRDINSKILAERQAGLFLWDVNVGGASTFFTDFIPNNALDPLRPALILPEVLDDSKWHSGFQEGFVDKAGLYVYQGTGHLSAIAQVNRDVAPEAELRTMDDLLAPKWKGKIAWQDPRLAGAGQSFAEHLLAVKGEEWLRKLLAQDSIILNDPRMLLEGLVRGSYAVAIGTRADEREEFKKEGLLGRVIELDRDSPAGARPTGGSGFIGLFNKAPHPNAAKVFINWFLSKQGQEVHVRLIAVGSRRLDVEGQPYNALVPGVKYLDVAREEYAAIRERAVEVAKEMLR